VSGDGRPSLDRTVPTNRWVGASGLALLAGGVGILTQHPGLLLAGSLGVVFAAYAGAASRPAPVLELRRELSDERPAPGDRVQVTLTVENVGDTAVADLRLVDGVPPALTVASGSARHGTALRPGATARFRYTVTATRGEHEWEPTQVIMRDASGALERERRLTPDSETTLRCTPRLEATTDLPLRGLTTQYTGRVATDVAGTGVEFYSTRHYRPGDPLRRIDWNRWARTGELATLEFREERAATVVLLLDARASAYRQRDEDAPNAVERSVDAAGRAFVALEGGGDRVGLAAFGPEELWLPPGSGSDHRARARQLLATHPALSPTPVEGKFFPSIRLRRLRRRLSPDAQILLFSPLCDDYMASVARRLDAYGHLVTVISPDPTADGTAAHRLARVNRRNRISRLRAAGLRVVDWGDEPLAAEITRARGRWST
jgi:uncharacterized repeat protein (TIGR01451 family)